MEVAGFGPDNYLVLNGVVARKEIQLREGIDLLRATWNGSLELLDRLSLDSTDCSIANLLLPFCGAQIRVHSDSDDEEVWTSETWNALWDGVLLGALLDADVVCNFETSVPLEDLDESSEILVTNYHLSGTPPIP